MENRQDLPAGWKWVKLGEVCEYSQYGLTVSEFISDSGFPLIRITDIDDFGNISTESMKYVSCGEETLKRYGLKEGDILFARTGSIGRTFLYTGNPPKSIFASYLIRFVPKRTLIDPYYLFYYTHSPGYFAFVEEKKHTVSQPNINAEEFKSLIIPLPPLSLQKRIAEKLKMLMDDINEARSSCEKQLEAAKFLPSAYLREVFESPEAQKWERKNLGEVCQYDSGIWGDEPDGSENCYPVLRSNNIKDGKMLFDDIATRKVNLKYVGSKLLRNGDILVTTSSG
ncbi:MAG: restriction endonuclease subunit S, partial [Caldisericaceae bacterium]